MASWKKAPGERSQRHKTAPAAQRGEAAALQVEHRTQQALEALLTMAEEIAAPQHEAEYTHEAIVAQRLAALICRVLTCKRASITTIDPAGQTFRSVAVVGLAAEEEQQWRERRPGTTLRGYLNDPLLSDTLRAEGVVELDLTRQPYPQPPPYGIQTLLLVSMDVESRQVGILALDHDGKPHHYTPSERALAHAVGRLGALVLERERLVAERADALAQQKTLREANERMDDFISLVSHELRTPLTTIYGTLQLITRRLGMVRGGEHDIAWLDERMDSIMAMLEAAQQQARHQNRLINDLLDSSRIQEGKLAYQMDTCDLAALVREQVLAARQFAATRPLELVITTDAATIWGDAGRLGQVLDNFLTNALKYTPPTSPIQVSLTRADATLRVAVADQGPGLAPEDQAHIWERFYRVPGREAVSGSARGLGLGLFICRTIIAAHHGQVGVTSTPGLGATFWFTIPAA
jgi:signal transduction histidine kinase